MAATAGYQAAPETNDVILSYAPEATWGTLPAVQFQAIRTTGESMASTRDRSRPQELNPVSEVIQAVTTRVQAGGGINFALSFGTFDDLFACVMGNDWQAQLNINGAAGDITLTNNTATQATLSSGTANKFQAVQQGQWIRLLGFTNANNNGFYYVATKVSSTSLTLTSLVATTTETPSGTNAKVRGSTIVNSSLFKSVYLQKQMGASNLFFRYPGTFMSGLTLQGSQGNFMSGSLTAVSQQELSSASNASTGAVLAAPSGTVHDSVAGFGGLFVNESPVSAGVDSVSLTMTRQNAGAVFAMGSASAAGMMRGRLEVTGQIKLMFRDMTHYTMFANETQGRISFLTRDAAGQAYIGTWLNAALMNPQIAADSPDTIVYATFDVEGNPQSAGGTFRLDRFLAA